MVHPKVIPVSPNITPSFVMVTSRHDLTLILTYDLLHVTTMQTRALKRVKNPTGFKVHQLLVMAMLVMAMLVMGVCVKSRAVVGGYVCVCMMNSSGSCAQGVFQLRSGRFQGKFRTGGETVSVGTHATAEEVLLKL